MATENVEAKERWEEFYRRYYKNDIGKIAQGEKTSLSVDYADVETYDPDLADDLVLHPDETVRAAENALGDFDIAADVSLESARVRFSGFYPKTGIRSIRSDDVNKIIAVEGIVRKATEVRPKVLEAAFECQRCGTLTTVEQTGQEFSDPHECRGCERQGPFRLLEDQSDFVDAQKLRVQESPEGLRGGQTPQKIDVNIEGDVTGEVSPGDRVTATGVLRATPDDGSTTFEVFIEGNNVEIEDQDFEDFEITEEDVEAIREIANSPNLYENIRESFAPSIYGYEKEKLAMILQLFAGVTKNLPDGTRIRGDMHILLVGDPGTGKCVSGDTRVTLADGRRVPIRRLVERNLDEPKPVDDGVYDEADFEVPSLNDDGSVGTARAGKVWKRDAPDRMYRIRTSRGRELEVTPSHPLFVRSGTGFEAKEAERLHEGEFVATPEMVPVDGSDRIDVGYRNSEANNAVRLELPDEWTPHLARLVGYVVGEGYVELRDNNTGYVSLTNNDREVIEDVRSAFDGLGLNYFEREPHDRKDAREVVCCSSEFVTFLSELEPDILRQSAEQSVPEAIQRAGSGIRKGFLRAYFEGEATVSRKEREIGVASMSRELLEDVRSLLLSFRVDSSLNSRDNGSYRLRVSGKDFVRYTEDIGFVTERKSERAEGFEGITENTNTDIVPGVGDELRRVRSSLVLTQSECGLPRATYQHYERGDRNPSRDSLRRVVDAFEDRLDELRATREKVEEGGWKELQEAREELGMSQRALASSTDVTQTAVSYYERNDVLPDGGVVGDAKENVLGNLDEGMSVAEDVRGLRRLVDEDVRWEKIESIETVEPDYDHVYDLEVEGTHSYVSEGIFSHNSQLLQYAQKIAPRGIYTSGKGATSAGLCVAGDTLVHTRDGFRRIRDIVEPKIPEAVETETATDADLEAYTYDHRNRRTTLKDASKVWRMPERDCHEIETERGKTVEASTNTPVLTCGTDGLEWKEIADVEEGDHVGSPKYISVERTAPSPVGFVDFENERLKLGDGSVDRLVAALKDEYGTLRDAAEALDLTEAFVYGTLRNRHVPYPKLRRVLDAVDVSLTELETESVTLRHGHEFQIPDEFDEDLMYLIGLVFGDGNISVSRRGENRGDIRISNGDESVLREAVRITEEKFGKEVEIERQEGRVPCVRLGSYTVAKLFHGVGMRTPKNELALDDRLTIAEHANGFLRGLYDADGSVSARDDGGSCIHLCTVSEELARQVQAMLETYGVHAKRRERDRRGEYETEDGRTVETTSIQHHIEMYGRDIDEFAERVGFAVAEKSEALEGIAGSARKGETVPVGGLLASTEPSSSAHHRYVSRGSNPGRGRAEKIPKDIELGDTEPSVAEAVEAPIRWSRVVRSEPSGRKEVFDLTVPETHNFVANGVVTHNTAAAVQDDFGDGKWTLEAGALVLADKGIACVDEVDKMDQNDRSALHEALEQQQVSIAKAGINATLKSRCSLLGAANPKYGRFDQYEGIAEQIDLEPALISRFDLIFTVTDSIDEEEDADIASHILQSNYAGEVAASGEDAEEEQESIDPEIEPETLRKYVAYARRECNPRMTDEARERIKEFYVDLRAQGSDGDAVPVTARKLEALVRLAESSARVRISDKVEMEDAERAIDVTTASLDQVGRDPETGEFDIDVIESGTSQTQRDRIKGIKEIISTVCDKNDGDKAPMDEIVAFAEEHDMSPEKTRDEIDSLRRRGELIEPEKDHFRLV